MRPTGSRMGNSTARTRGRSTPVTRTVVFWATLDFQPVPEQRDHWLLADGTDFAWKCNEHCLLLVGYDAEHYWFNDPWHDHGLCCQPKALVEACHAAQGMFAVTLRRR